MSDKLYRLFEIFSILGNGASDIFPSLGEEIGKKVLSGKEEIASDFFTSRTTSSTIFFQTGRRFGSDKKEMLLMAKLSDKIGKTLKKRSVKKEFMTFEYFF